MTTLEQRAKEVAIEVWGDLWGNNAGMEVTKSAIAEREIIERHLTSFATKAANAAAEAVRDECLKLICRYQSLHPEWVQELIGKVAYIGEDSAAWLQRHDAAVAKELADCLKALVYKVISIEPYINDMCIMEGIHGRPYSGPNWGKELTDAKERLAALEKEAEGKS